MTTLQEYQKLANIPVQNLKNKLRFDNSAMDGEDKNPNWGKMYIETENESKELDLANSRFFLARSRTQIRCSDMVLVKDKKTAKYWCRESDDSYITLMDADNKEVTRGTYKQLKDDYKLKYCSVAYLYHEASEKIYRFVINPSSISNWFDFQKKLRNPYWFKIRLGKKNTDGAFPFYVLDFERGEEFDLDKACELSTQVAQDLDAYYKQVDGAKQIEAPPVADKDLAGHGQPNMSEDEDLSGLPF